jgi:hypothetical protein
MKMRGLAWIAAAISLPGMGCGGSSGSKPNMVSGPGQNVAPIAVNSGVEGNYANGAFVSVTVCIPGSSTCQTIPNILVDTGSSGLRIVSSVLTISLSQQQGTNGQPVAECFPFLIGLTWGPIDTADVQIAGESAKSVPIQVLSDTAFPIPSACQSSGLQSQDTVESLGANGILGVGLAAQDCGGACDQTGSANPGLYYQCPSSGCQVTALAVSNQVQNPVTMFATDNNGVIMEFPAVNGSQVSLNGSLVFGIGTQSNNGLNGATVYAVNSSGYFTSVYQGQSYANSFLDSGSNGYFFLNSSTTGIPDCTMAIGFYCPTSPLNLSAMNQGQNGTSGTVNLTVGNAQTLFSNSADAVFNSLGGPGYGGFDWGLPFFYGRNVFIAIEGSSTPGGTGPYWAY